LSDFFYGWLQRSIGNVHGELFAKPLAPKDEECVALSHRAAMYRHKDPKWFEDRMTEACAESRRVTKPSGIGVFVFANKETAGWEAMLGYSSRQAGL
jgi:putative DNA methylase